MNIFDHGRGPAVLLLHGSPTAVSYFDPLVEALVQRFRVLVPEFPGYGRSPMLPVGAGFVASQEQLIGDLAAMGVNEVAVVGFSLGAYRALDLAVNDRLKVSAIVTMGGFASLTPEHRAGMEALGNQIRGWEAFEDLEFRRTIAGLMLAPAHAKAHPEWLAAADSWLDAVSPLALSEELIASKTNADLTPKLQSLDVPITLRCGELDAATPLAYSEQIAALAPRARVQKVPGCGHALLIEDREATVDAIVKALGGR